MSAKTRESSLILLIENDEADVFFFRRALANLQFTGSVRVVSSVSEARDYIEGAGHYSDRTYFRLPDLIVSDMNLSGSTGNEFLEWLRQQPSSVAQIPFVFLSGTFVPADKERAGQLGADSFHAKTGDFQVMKGRVQEMLQFLSDDGTQRNRPDSTGKSE